MRDSDRVVVGLDATRFYWLEPHECVLVPIVNLICGSFTTASAPLRWMTTTPSCEFSKLRTTS